MLRKPTAQCPTCILHPEPPWMHVAVLEVLYATAKQHGWNRSSAFEAVCAEFKVRLGARFDPTQYEMLVDADQFRHW